jgi:hypothetical protein
METVQVEVLHQDGKKVTELTRCWFCNTEMVWSGDFTFEDYCIQGNGVVAILTCPNPLCEASAEFYTKIEEEGELN